MFPGVGFEIEAMSASTGAFFEAAYRFDIVAGGQTACRLEADGVFTPDVPQVVGTGTSPGGEEKKVTLTFKYHER